MRLEMILNKPRARWVVVKDPDGPDPDQLWVVDVNDPLIHKAFPHLKFSGVTDDNS
jgi:hypothetical protein